MDNVTTKLLALKTPGFGEVQAPDGIPSGSKYTIGALTTLAIEVMLVVGVLVALAYLVYGGFYWVQTRGDKENLDKARRKILYSIVGLLVMALSLVVVNVITNALGIESVIGN